MSCTETHRSFMSDSYRAQSRKLRVHDETILSYQPGCTSPALRACCQRATGRFEPGPLPAPPGRLSTRSRSWPDAACWPWPACAQIAFVSACCPYLPSV